MILCVFNWTETYGEFIWKVQKVGFGFLHRVLTSIMCLTSSMTPTCAFLATTSTSQKTLKLRICGLPFSDADSAEHESFGKLDVKLTIKFCKKKSATP